MWTEMKRKEGPRLGVMGWGRPANRRCKQERAEEGESSPAWAAGAVGVISRSWGWS